jgi:hypothetical protein
VPPVHVCPGCAGLCQQSAGSDRRFLLTLLIWELGTEGPCYWYIYMQSSLEGSSASNYNVMCNKRYETYRRGMCKIWRDCSHEEL